MKQHKPDRQLADRMKNSILCDLYALPTRKRIQRDIMEALGIHLHEVQLYAYRKQLVAEELIKEYEDGTTDCEVEITLKGYEAIQLFGTYQDYCREKKKQAQSERSLQYLKERNLRLTNLNIIIGFLSFIAGILLSGPVKTLLSQWLAGG